MLMIRSMASRGGSSFGAPKVKRVMTQAINLIFEFLKNVGFVSCVYYACRLSNML